MRPFILLSAAAALASAQSFDLEVLDSLAAPANITVPSDVESQIVNYDSDSAASSVETSVLTSDNSVDLSDSVSDAVNSTATLQKRDACAAQPTGYGAVPSPDTDSAFLAYADFKTAATSAPVPSGYSQAFSNLNASNNAYGYLGYTALEKYDTEACANKCNAISACAAFNVYFERDPSVDPGTGCDDPSSTTMIKCVFWGGPVTEDNAVNAGQYRDNFHVVIAGSNGYVNNTIEPADGFSGPAYYGSNAVDAPNDCNGQSTYLGNATFSNGPFDASLCAAACNAKSAVNIKSNLPTCKYFNTYILSRNGVALEQYCQMYSQTWASSYATNSGATSGSNQYTISHSYGFSSSADAGTCKQASTSTWVVASTASATASATTIATHVAGDFLNWTTFKANGANLGGWLEKEQTHDPIWWASVANLTETPDEWTLCETLGDSCGSIFEARYESFLNTSTIDQLATVGVNTLRYA